MGCCGSKTKDNEEKELEELEELEMKPTEIEDLDKLFDSAAAPFNEAIGLKENLEETVASFKTLVGLTEEDSLKDIFLGLKQQIPELTLEIGPDFKIQLDAGTEYAEGDIIVNILLTMSAINDLIEQISELFDTAIESAKDIIERASEFQDMVKDADLSVFEVAIAVKNTFHNVKEFGKVDDIAKAFKQMVCDLIDEFKEVKEVLESE